MAERLMDQEARQSPVAVHKRVQEYEAEGSDCRRYQGVDFTYWLIGEGHQLFHQFPAKFRGWRNIADARRAAQAVVQMILLMAKRDSLSKGLETVLFCRSTR